MEIDKTLQLSRCHALSSCGSKKSALELASKLIAKDYPALSADYVFTQLLSRERLGSTGIGQGIAIPHCRVENCTSVISTLLTLENGIDFEAIDSKPVDIIFILVVPDEATDAHVVMLADLAKVFSDKNNLEKLRTANSDKSLYEIAQAIFKGST